MKAMGQGKLLAGWKKSFIKPVRTMSLKRLLLAFLFCFLPALSRAQEGIRFDPLNLDSARETAGLKHRLVFVDVFTAWCRPCKLMDQEVFSQTATGSFFNARFINIRIDAEKGTGVSIALRYLVPSFPCYLFLDPEGKLIFLAHGFCNGDQLIAIAREALERYPGSPGQAP